MGALTPIGLSVQELWAGLLEGRSGAGLITRFDASAFPTTFACELKGFDPLDHMQRKLANRLDPFAQYAVAAAGEAIRDAGLEGEALSDEERDRVGVVFGSGQGGLTTFQNQTKTLLERGPGRLSPFFVPMMIPDIAAGVIAIEHGFRGPNHCVVSACATGNHNIADGLALIQRGDAEVVVTGGSEAAICEVGLGGFTASRALSRRNDAPEAASRPFDTERDGFVIGEGAGALVLESLEHARRREANIYAEVAAVGASADAYHMTAPHPDGVGAALALSRALRSADLAPHDVDVINMHATSTPLGDESECRAVRTVLGPAADRIVATSTKSMTGHLLGGAGAVEAIASILSIVHGVVPPTINLASQDPECDLPVVANAPIQRDVRVALSNAFGFGGHNTTLVLRRLEE